MEIQATAYAENKCSTLERLDQYYQEVTDDVGEMLPTVSPYAETDDKISLECEIDGKVVGRLVGNYDHLTFSVRIEALFVDTMYRGKNVGALLVAKFEADARERGVQISFVDTTSSSAPTFYEKQGYSRIGEIGDYPMPGEVYYLYMKRLK